LKATTTRKPKIILDVNFSQEKMDGAGEPSCSPIKPSQAPADSAPHSVFGRQEFKPDERNAIRELLQQKLGKEHLATRPGSAGGTRPLSWLILMFLIIIQNNL